MPLLYETQTTLMDYGIQARQINDLSVAKDPGPNIQFIAAGGTVSVVVFLASAEEGDKVSWVVQNGATRKNYSATIDEDYGHSLWWAWFRLDKSSGTWRMSFSLNGRRVVEHIVRVR